LRRYARALSGSQASGDAYVAATLEALLQDMSSVSAAPDKRVALYALFTRVWNSVPVNGAAATLRPTRQLADERIAMLTARPRQAFILQALEGFTEEEASAVLGVSVPEFARLVEQAGQQLAEQMATTVLIIEDEPLIAMDLEAIVESYGHTVQGVARTRSEAAKLCAQAQPGLVLADVQLADGSSGLDAVGDILSAFQVPVIFITAYPERLLTGERPEPTFLIAKPFQPAHVGAVIGQALFFEQNSAAAPARASA
jgi:CheY-like chemotaxis protein